MKIIGIDKNSIAEELGIEIGSKLISFDNFKAVDILDYEFYNSQENFCMVVETRDGLVEFDIDKYVDEDLGLSFDSELTTRQCCNKCMFCFIDQLPDEKLRPTLHIKDDDYRHSFISGTYVTMTNLRKPDLDRIIRLKLSPLYISVHSTDSEIRNKLLGNFKAPDIVRQMTYLHNFGIVMHTQIVYCPTYNDDLKNSIETLYKISDSLAIVPVGLTYNSNPKLKPVGKKEAEFVIDTVSECQKKILKETGSRFVFASDEFYVKAARQIPDFSEYEDFLQIENGVGLLAQFEYDFNYALNIYDGNIGHISIATGVSAFEFIKDKAKKLTDKFGGQIDVYRIDNTFFGETITVAGLVVGSDILRTLKNKQLGEKLIIPKCMLKEFKDVFLDDMPLCNLEKQLDIKIQPINTDGESFVKVILNKENINE